jgi:hypothetical protein
MTLGMERAHTYSHQRSYPRAVMGQHVPVRSVGTSFTQTRPGLGISSGMRYVYRRTPSFFYGVSGHGIDSWHRILQHTPRFSFDEFRQISTQTDQGLTSMGGSTK